MTNMVARTSESSRIALARVMLAQSVPVTLGRSNKMMEFAKEHASGVAELATGFPDDRAQLSEALRQQQSSMADVIKGIFVGDGRMAMAAENFSAKAGVGVQEYARQR